MDATKLIILGAEGHGKTTFLKGLLRMSLERNKDLPRYSLDAFPAEPLALWISDKNALVSDFPDFNSAYVAMQNPRTRALALTSKLSSGWWMPRKAW